MAIYSIRRTIYTYSYLRDISIYFLNQARKDHKHRDYNLISSILYSTFCIEGYINYIGRIQISNWKKIERSLGRRKRLEKVMNSVRITYNFEQRPYNTYLNIFNFRDALVHSEVIKLSKSGTQEKVTDIPPMPVAVWENLLTLKRARMIIYDTGRIIKKIHKNAGFHNDPLYTIWKIEYQAS
jgi:hypothetical protein